MDTSLINLFSVAEDYFSQSVAKRTQDFQGMASAYSADINDSPLNTLVIRSHAPSLLQLVIEACVFFALTNTPWCLIMRADLVNKEALSILARHGFSADVVSVAMVLDLEKVDRTPEDLAIKDMDARLKEWAIPLRAYPATSENVAMEYANSHQLALKRTRNLHHLSLFNNNDIVSSLTLSWNDNWARIDDVSTLPEHQGKGFASVLMNYALSLAAQNGARFCFLEASPKGLSIYQKLGFKELFKNQVFLRKV